MTTERIAKEQQAAAGRLPGLMTDEVLSAIAVAANSCPEDRAAAVAFVLWCHECADRPAPDFRKLTAATRLSSTLLTDDALDAMTVAAIARTHDQCEAIAFVLWSYKQAGRPAPEFGRFSEVESSAGE